MVVQSDAAMKIVFRVDASIQIGTGHVMRCLTLADALKDSGAECHFICREHNGHLLSFIRDKGYVVHPLAHAENDEAALRVVGKTSLAHAAWLGVSQEEDAKQCKTILASLQPDWLIIDHYAIDASWELMLSDNYRQLMVIDDLADRNHLCDLLLDQTFGRNTQDYQPLVPDSCILLCGSEYALLRPEFAALRPFSLQRRENPKLEHLLITMGGVDKDNATGQVLDALRSCVLPESCKITVVMGSTAPWLRNVQQQAVELPWPAVVKVNVHDMALLMADSDLAIGAAGATSWERCCLGLPTILLVLADNQHEIAINLKQINAAKVIVKKEHLGVCLPSLLASLISLPTQLTRMSEAAADILHGHGVSAVIKHLES